MGDAKRPPRSPPADPGATAVRADFEVLAMTAADYAEVLALWESSAGIGLSESDTAEGVAAFLERNPGLSVVARAGAVLVGAVLCGYDGRVS